MRKQNLILSLAALLVSGGLWAQTATQAAAHTPASQPLKVGAERTELYVPQLKGKRVAVLCNHTATIGGQLLVDSLQRLGVDLRFIFAPEHGFRGDADAGAVITNGVDPKTGIAVVSVYGGEKEVRPADSLMKQVDVAIFDIQDVGLRYYTYLSSMYYLMDACATNNVKLIVLDRPNPNGCYVDGPLLDMKHRSFVGIVPVPVVHGMTFGELARMINGEKWLKEGMQCNLEVVPVAAYTHATRYELPLKPSPNLPTIRSIYLYPSLCYFEGTVMSMGRGTQSPFELYGHPEMKGYSFSFTPRPVDGAQRPTLNGKLCYGVDLRTSPSNDEIIAEGVNLAYVVDAYRNLNMGEKFFKGSFERLIGVDYVRKMIMEGKSAPEIEAMWKDDVSKFIAERKPYLLYTDVY